MITQSRCIDIFDAMLASMPITLKNTIKPKKNNLKKINKFSAVC
jgi:hypothetical protein